MSNRNDDWKNSNFKATFSNRNADQEEITSLRASREKENHYNLNVATFTFGGRQNNINNFANDKILENKNSNNYLKSNNNIKNNLSRSKDKEQEKDENDQNHKGLLKNQNQNFSKFNNDIPTIINNSVVSNNTQQTNTSQDISHLTTVVHINNSSTISNDPTTALNNIPPQHGPVLLNRMGDHNSFLSVVIHALWNIKFLRYFIINDLNTLYEKESKNKLFYHLKSLFSKYERNKVLDMNKLRVALAETFQNRRKFLLDQPDDPVDCYFAFINAIHSHHIQTSLGEIKDTNCYNKCLAHKYLWIDLCRVDSCECQGTSKRLFSYHNYIFDIPLEKIFNLTNNVNLIEMTKSFKLKSLNAKNQSINNIGNELNHISTVNNLSDLKGKLFLYYKLLFNQLKTDCPQKGAACEINKTNRAFFLTNIPFNLSFGLINPKRYAKIFSHMEILKSFILIPKILDLSILFDYSSKQKVFYEFFGGFLIKPSKAYSCFFRQYSGNKNENLTWIYYDCGKITSNGSEQNHTISFNNWFDLISHFLANGEYPIMLFYQIQQKYIDLDKDLSNEEIQTLERYAKSADNLHSIVVNKFRPTEEIIKSEPSSSSNSVHLNNNPIHANDLNNLKSGSKDSSNNSSSRNTSNNNSQSRIDTGEYNCIYCFAKNRMDNILCYKCGQNNAAVVEEILKKRHLNNNYINIANFNLNINTDDKISFRTNDITNDKSNNNQIYKNANDYSEHNLIENNSKYIPQREIRNETERDSVKNSSIKKHSESIQPQNQNRISKNPFETVNTKKERERTPTNISTINHDEDMRLKHLNMPKQISNKNITTNKQIHNSHSKDNYYSNERPSHIITNKEYLNSPPGHNMKRSNSKKNLQFANQNNINNPNINATIFVPDNLKIAKLETITTSSYVSTPVFNKEKDKEKPSDREKNKINEDRFKPFDQKDKKKINSLNAPNNLNQDKNNLIKNQPISIERKTNNINNPKNIHDHWICEVCSSVNKNNNHKCIECKRSYNSSIRGSLKNESLNYMSENNLKETDSFTANNIQETFGNRNSKNPLSYVNQVQINLNNVNNKKNQSLEKKHNQNIITSPSMEKKMINNYFSEKSESKNNNICPCQSHFEESLIKNSHCRLCGRYIEINVHNNYNSHQNQPTSFLDNILKKKGYENDFNNNQSKPNLKKHNEKEKPIMIHENNKKKEFEKMKSPTSNNIKPRITQGPITNNKFEDERINHNIHHNVNNPFNKPASKEKDSKEKELSRQIRMNSTNKRNKLEINKLRK